MSRYHRGVIKRLMSLPSSRNGNPRWALLMSDGVLLSTGIDASVAYGLGNPEYQNVPVRLTLNKQGNVVGIAVSNTAVSKRDK